LGLKELGMEIRVSAGINMMMLLRLVMLFLSLEGSLNTVNKQDQDNNEEDTQDVFKLLDKFRFGKEFLSLKNMALQSFWLSKRWEVVLGVRRTIILTQKNKKCNHLFFNIIILPR
jgi:hypothetical protein